MRDALLAAFALFAFFSAGVIGLLALIFFLLFLLALLAFSVLSFKLFENFGVFFGEFYLRSFAFLIFISLGKKIKNSGNKSLIGFLFLSFFS